jgi:hypothetical protein
MISRIWALRIVRGQALEPTAKEIQDNLKILEVDATT